MSFGHRLDRLQFIEGLLYPFPLCGELIPDFSTGHVQRTVLFTPDEIVVQKESKDTPSPPGVLSCGVAGYVQSLEAARNAAGTVIGFGGVCNSILTDPANLEDVNIDLAVKTVDQKATLGRNATELFRVDLFNLGIASVPASNISLEFHFDGSAWQIQQFGNTVCTDIQAHKGVVDRIVVGKRCMIPGYA